MRSRIRAVILSMETFRKQKLTVLIPLFIILLLVAVLLVLINVVSPVIPFFYSLF